MQLKLKIAMRIGKMNREFIKKKRKKKTNSSVKLLMKNRCTISLKHASHFNYLNVRWEKMGTEGLGSMKNAVCLQFVHFI